MVDVRCFGISPHMQYVAENYKITPDKDNAKRFRYIEDMQEYSVETFNRLNTEKKDALLRYNWEFVNE